MPKPSQALHESDARYAARVADEGDDPGLDG